MYSPVQYEPLLVGIYDSPEAAVPIPRTGSYKQQSCLNMDMVDAILTDGLYKSADRQCMEFGRSR
jgi:hypothetical protein